MKTTMWKTFYFESNMFFDHVKCAGDWQRLRAAYPDMTDEQLLDAKEATYGGHRPQAARDEHPNYGFRHEHDGERTLREFFAAHGMCLPSEANALAEKSTCGVRSRDEEPGQYCEPSFPTLGCAVVVVAAIVAIVLLAAWSHGAAWKAVAG